MYEETKEVRTYTLKLSFTIHASRETVWRGLTSELSSWYPSDALAGPEGTVIQLDLVPGGKMVELWPDGGGLVWGEVSTIRPASLLQMTGELFPDWGGPAFSCRTHKLTGDGDECLLEFEEVSVGSLAQSTLQSLEEGWTYIFGDKLKNWCENQH